VQGTDVCDGIVQSNDDTMLGHRMGMGSSTGASLNGREAGKAREVTVRWMEGADELLSLQVGPIRDQIRR